MTNKEYVLETLKRSGKLAAQAVQEKSAEMTGTELNAEDAYIPSFSVAVQKMNMLERRAGQVDGFVCKSTAGRIVRLIQNYDSTIYTQEPEELSAQWRFVWSTDPAKALPFIALSTSPYAKGDCCLNSAGEPKRSNIDNNTWNPDEVPQYWDDVGVDDE